MDEKLRYMKDTYQQCRIEIMMEIGISEKKNVENEKNQWLKSSKAEENITNRLDQAEERMTGMKNYTREDFIQTLIRENKKLSLCPGNLG